MRWISTSEEVPVKRDCLRSWIGEDVVVWFYDHAFCKRISTYIVNKGEKILMLRNIEDEILIGYLS